MYGKSIKSVFSSFRNPSKFRRNISTFPPFKFRRNRRNRVNCMEILLNQYFHHFGIRQNSVGILEHFLPLKISPESSELHKLYEKSIKSVFLAFSNPSKFRLNFLSFRRGYFDQCRWWLYTLFNRNLFTRIFSLIYLNRDVSWRNELEHKVGKF